MLIRPLRTRHGLAMPADAPEPFLQLGLAEKAGRLELPRQSVEQVPVRMEDPRGLPDGAIEPGLQAGAGRRRQVEEPARIRQVRD